MPHRMDSMALPSPELLSVLRCPVTKSALRVEGEELVATVPGPDGSYPRYPIINSIPRLIPAQGPTNHGAPESNDAAVNTSGEDA